MVQSVTELISCQETIFRDLKLICTNYKKDSPTRKNLAYLEERLSRLNNNWEKFVQNHQLLEESGATDLQYFNDGIFNSTKKMYEEVLQDMLKRKSELPSTSTSKTEQPPAAPKQGKGQRGFDDINFHIPPRETSESTEKQQDLLRQQYCNFRAFERTVEKIKIALAVPMEKWELEDNLSTLKTKWEHVEKANWELDYILQDEDSIYQQKYNTEENLYDDLKRKLQLNIWNNAHYEKSTPKIQIPDFHGNYNQWLTFRDLYLESVDNNPTLSKAQKMQHLKTKLKGEAEKLVQHLGISAENYASCWEMLTHRYDNKRLLFTSYMNTLLNQPSIQQPTAESIRKLHDVMMECLNGLKNIGVDTTNWDPIVVHLLIQKLDSVTHNEYIKEVKHPREFPDLEEFAEFLESKFMSLEALQGSSQRLSSSNKPWKLEKQPHKGSENRNNNYKNKMQGSSYVNKSQNLPKVFFTTAKTCPICKTNHVLMNCVQFLAMNINKRNDAVRNLHICKNCLFSHGEKQCKSRKTCKLCHKAHHTLMHEDETDLSSNKQATREENPSSTLSTSYGVNNITNEEKEVLLTTVLLKVKTIDGNFINLRGLLDQGSQVSLITENAAQRLRLQRRKVSAVVSGVGTLSGNCKGAMNLECQSIHSDYKFNFEALIMKKLIGNLPTASFSISNWDYLENLKLADPQFNLSGPIDLLLGADIYSELILNGVHRSDKGYPVAQQTKVGWILCGKVKTFNCLATLNDFENMARFWETEEIPDKSSSTSEEQHCQEYYNTTTTRLANGQYVVQMPMKPNFETNLKSARSQALAQFLQLERKMLKNKELSHEYKRFMNEYIAMGHMKPVTGESRGQVYLPHHGVLRAESTTTKLRVVFNASYKTKGDRSLNDHMDCGPNLQKNILTLLINWRTYRYVFTADVEKFYRFIWLNKKQQHLQTIIWRSSPNELPQDWQLGTVIYGTKVAPMSKRITVPRMELCGAVLLAKLLEKVQKTLCNKNLHIRCWSDSKVVLSWLQGDINRWEKYVANRMKQINSIISANCWNYVKSEENPADCATRGLTPFQLLDFKLWWNGPDWLKTNTPEIHQNNRLNYITNTELQEINCCAVTFKKCEIIDTLLNKHSNYKRVIRVLGWILRLSNIRKQKRTLSSTNNLADCGNKKVVMSLSPQDIMGATELVIKNVQNENYGDEMECLKKNRPLCPLTEDVEDLEYLTPGHFLIGGPLLSLPQEEQDFAEHDLRNIWRLVEQMNKHIWKRWSNEYLHQLRIRSKWQNLKENLKQGSLVLVKDKHLPPGRWAIGRVQELHPGADGRVRVITLKTNKGSLKRPITKLSPLPLKLEESRLNGEEEKRIPTQEPKKRRGTTINKNNWLSFVLLFILAMTGFALSAQTRNSLKITPIPSNHPIYFDEAGKIQLIHDEWTLLVYYNLTSYWQATDRINEYVNQIDKLCQRISHEYTPCETIVGHLRHELSHLVDYNSMLLTQHSRPKRGYFDGVGKLAGTLFGVLDADFAEKYERDIQNLRSNDDYLLQLMKNQTLIVEAENNIIKRNTAFMDKQFRTLRVYMNQTCNEITKIVNKAQMLFTMNDINSAAVTSTLILTDLNRILEMLINALANIYKGHLDTHLFPANQLIEQLNIISGRLPQGLSLPVKDIQRDLKNIYDLIHVKARITKTYMLFEIHIPLLSDEDYKIYRVVPIPFLRQGHLKLVQPSSSFIAINFVKNSYITMEDQDMRQCTPYGEDEFICVSRNPVYNMHNKDAPCEAQVFNQQESLSCVLNDVTCKETWTKLHKPNMWLFTLCGKQLMRVICNDQVTPAVIDGTGVISLKSKCLLQKKDATIFTHNQLGSSLNMKPEIEIPTINSTINNIFDLGWKNAKLNITDQETPTAVETRKIDQQLEFQKSREILPNASDMSSHYIYLYSVTSLLLGGIAVLALFIIIKRWCKTLSAKTEVTPRGRDNFGGDIELQEIHSTAAEPVYSEARQPKKAFHFDELN